jgi:hypothetical protein
MSDLSLFRSLREGKSEATKTDQTVRHPAAGTRSERQAEAPLGHRVEGFCRTRIVRADQLPAFYHSLEALERTRYIAITFGSCCLISCAATKRRA